MHSIVRSFGRAFVPHQIVSKSVLRLIIAVQLAIFAGAWLNMGGGLMPTPSEVLQAFDRLWFRFGLAEALWRSFTLNLEALAWTTLISLMLSYLTVVPAIRPSVLAITKARYLSFVGTGLALMLLLGVGRSLSVATLTVAMTVYMLTTMCDVVSRIEREEIDHARTLRMGPWREVLEIVVIGRRDQAIEAMRQNAAIGWMMLPGVEIVSRANGGIGILLFDQDKYLRLDGIVVIQLLVIAVALMTDAALGLLKRIVSPYAHLTQAGR